MVHFWILGQRSLNFELKTINHNTNQNALNKLANHNAASAAQTPADATELRERLFDRDFNGPYVDTEVVGLEFCKIAQFLG